MTIIPAIWETGQEFKKLSEKQTKKKERKKTGVMAQEIKHMSSKHEALSSNHSTIKKNFLKKHGV
jgi:hypothetical protein